MAQRSSRPIGPIPNKKKAFIGLMFSQQICGYNRIDLNHHFQQETSNRGLFFRSLFPQSHMLVSLIGITQSKWVFLSFDYPEGSLGGNPVFWGKSCFFISCHPGHLRFLPPSKKRIWYNLLLDICRYHYLSLYLT